MTHMFCSNCGKADQMIESYCRQCGTFLPDVSKLIKLEVPPEEHLKANTILSGVTMLVSFTLSFLLLLVLGFRGTHPLIYATAGFLFAIGCWHVQAFTRTLLLKEQWKHRYGPRRIEADLAEPSLSVRSGTTARSLNEGSVADAVPASVTENTTRHLAERVQPKR
jgi:hypothetical protein